MIVIIGVRPLESIYSFSDSHFGNKAINLSYLLSNEIGANYVLPGFCITFDMNNEYLPQLESFKTEIEKLYNELVTVSTRKMVIARSSADREDGTEILFPGVLKSITCITNFSELYQAVRQCVESALEISVRQYTQSHGVRSQFDFFSVLVQEELRAEYSGVAFTHIPYTSDGDIMVAQLACGDNLDLVKGIGISNLYSLFNNQEQLTYRCMKQEFHIDVAVEKEILEKLYSCISGLKKLFSHQLDIEWGYKSGEIYIYQVRPLKSLQSCTINDRCISAFDGNVDQGLKFQAMQFFVNHNLFQRKVFLFCKNTSIKEIEHTLTEQAVDVPFTVRFSNQYDIGLPRIFAPSLHDAISQIHRLKRDEWSVIAYSSLKVRESFELYLDKDKTILEHVPGMWESDSKLMADVALLTQNNISFWLVNEVRTAKYEDYSGVYMKKSDSIPLTRAYNYMKGFFPIIKKIRLLFERDFPLNLHFVSDGKRLFFLNCRLSQQIDWITHGESTPYVIHDISDCSKWDGKNSILFCPRLSRGEESSLFEFIPFLKQIHVPIYVDFGILSHPAILLREFGINVLPRLTHHKYYKIINIFAKKREDIKMENKQENPFLTKIIYEPQLLENECFGIVSDAEPIVPKHYLFYSKIWLPSIADCDTRAAANFLEENFIKLIKKPYSYFERGRASFCTSMNGVLHGHGHLVPMFAEDLSTLFPYGQVEEYPSLADAYDAVDADGQYLLWGNLGKQFYLIKNVEGLPKRTIRNTIRNFLN